MPSTRKSAEPVQGRKRRRSARSSLEVASSPKTKKFARRGSRSSLRMQNKMSGVTLPEIKDVDSLPLRKERTPRKSSKPETELTDIAVVDDVHFTENVSAVEETAAKIDENVTEDDSPCHDVGDDTKPTTADAEEEVQSENTETNIHEKNHAENETEKETISEPTPVISGESGPLHVQALA